MRVRKVISIENESEIRLLRYMHDHIYMGDLFLINTIFTSTHDENFSLILQLKSLFIRRV